eukprot:TRINITY_DN7180_c0_g1_i1.p1 TRINITY_DN7180_c0_g1~~TRINITY_DN7180_c0_g1_i1.p1  ORF type:complete len:128 (-),score=17.69 TRINITY_DN7180_c0_g1_i1:118-501(-)
MKDALSSRQWSQGDYSVTSHCVMVQRTESPLTLSIIEVRVTLDGSGSRYEAIDFANSLPPLVVLDPTHLAVLMRLNYHPEGGNHLTDYQVGGIIVGSIFGAFLLVGLILLAIHVLSADSGPTPASRV